jgi:glycosyltransferase involved in cell wall biosynthesis
MPRVSVLIPTYNRGELLLEAVRSVLAQTFADLEVIVADDGSTDGSLDAVLGLADTRVEVLRLPHSGRPAVARNAALAKAGGELVALLDSDDVWSAAKLERQVDVLEQDLSVGLVCSNARVIDETGNEIGALYLGAGETVREDTLAALLEDNFVVNSSAVARRELVERVGGFSEDIRLRGVEDYDLWLRVGAVSRLAYLPEPLVAYRRHEASVTAGVPNSLYWASVLVAVENLDRFLDEADPQRDALLRPRKAELLTERARAEAVERRPAAAVRSLAGAMRLDPKAATSLLLSGHTLRRAREAVRVALGRASAPT